MGEAIAIMGAAAALIAATTGLLTAINGLMKPRARHEMSKAGRVIDSMSLSRRGAYRNGRPEKQG